MSYDLMFLRQEPGEALLDAYERACEAQEAAAEAPRPLTDAERKAWDDLATQLVQIVPTAERLEGAEFVQVLDEALGLDITLACDSEASLSVAYGHEGPAAASALSTILLCVDVIERATGLLAFDPQTEDRFRREGETSEAATARAAAILGEGGAMLRSAVAESPKRWWQFWR